MICIDEVIVGISKEGWPLPCAGPLAGRIGKGGELRLDLARRSKGGIVEHLEILAHGTRRRLSIDPARVPIGLRRSVLLVCVRPNEAGVGCEGLTPNKSLDNAASHHALEQLPEEVTVAEPSVAVLREGRMVGHRIGQIEATEPAIRQVQMHLLAEPPLRPDTEGIAHDQHPDHQLGIDRGPAHRTVEWR